MPQKELDRLQAVNRLLNLQFSKEKELQEIVNFAAKICGTPTALITLIGEKTQHIKFKVGFEAETTSRDVAFCAHVIGQKDVMVIVDAKQDNRFADNILVTGDPHIRFYAGTPLTTQDGFDLGSLCVIDQHPKELSELQQLMLQALSKQVIQLLEIDNSIKVLKEQYIQAKRSEIELRSFFESSIDCHLLLGKDFEILAFNKALDRFINNVYGKTLVRGKQIAPYLSPQILDQFYKNYEKALKGTASFEQRMVNYGNEEIWWVIKYEPAFDPEGAIIGVSVNSSDATARVRQEQQVMAQNNSLKEIAFIQSHELRRPVASILGLMVLIKMDSRCSEIEEIKLMERAVEELDEKVRLVVGYTQ